VVLRIDIGIVDETVRRLTAPGQPLEVSEREFAGATHRVFVHAAATAVDVIQSLRVHGDAELLVFNDRRWTYEQFFDDVDALSATLQLDFGVTPGDRLAIAMRNCADWLITFAAAIQVGAVVVPVNSWGSGEELAFTLLNSEATVLAADLPRTQAALNTLAAARIPVLFSDVDGDATALPRLASSQLQIRAIPDAVASGRSRPYTLARRAPEDSAMLLYTSGSTGHPKGVVTRHVAVGQVLHNMMLAGYLSVELAGSTPAPGSLLPQSHLVTVPLFHVPGLFGGFLLPAVLGQKVVLLRKWSAQTAMALIEREKVTMLSTVPAILKDLLTDPRLGEYDCSSVSRAALAGAATPADLPGLLSDKLGVTGRASGYGMTESGSVGAAMSGPVFDLKPFAAGIISPIIELRVVDRRGHALPIGVEGEVQLRGVTVTPGYWRMAELTRGAFTDDGFLRTGDLGHVDDDGFLFITGRLKEIVIRGGENMSPVEIENVAYRHPCAKEVAVFGVSEEIMGEELAMVCHRQPGTTLTEAELRTHLRTVLPAFKVPKYVVVTDTPLPRNASEKIHRLALRESFVAT
jgi:long-chain acyl-CoA synthetase